MLRIQLFGPPAVTENNQPVIIKRRTTRALLFYIAAFQKPVSRDVLVDAFWPDKPLDRARLALADTLSKLRADLNDKTVLQVTPAFVSLNPDVTYVDWLDFYFLMTQIEKTPGAFTPNQSLSVSLYQKMSAAALLWNNHELIETDEVALSSNLDAWLTNIRSECAAFLRRVLPRLGQHETLVGNYNLAIHWLGLAHNLDEYNDDINTALIEAYLRARRYAEARTFFQEIKVLYADGIDADLPPFLRVLESRLDFSHPIVTVGEHPNWSFQPGLSVPFIGQRNALAELNSAGQQGGGIIVVGDGGSGKTHLVHEYCRQRGGGLRLLVASCQPLETNMPFAPWISLLRTSIHDETWQKLEASWAAPLSLLLPELITIRKDLQSLPPGRAETPRTVLLEAVYQLLRILARSNEIIIFLDDAHWADESSLALASYLLKKSFFDTGHGLLILAARTESNSPQLNEFVTSAHPKPLRRVHTQLFSMDELADLCYFVFSRTVPPKFLEKLYHDTGGNAFFSTQILQALLEENPYPDFEHLAALPMPAAITDAIQRKFQALSNSAQEVISTAAVLGSQFEIQLLEAALSLSTEDYLLALEELEQARIIHPLRAGDIIYGFVHEKLREGLLVQLNQNRKRLLHRKVATALEGHPSTNSSRQASLLAYHFESAGMFAKAFDAWVQAAQHARGLMAVYDAMDACRRAERLLEQSSGFSDAQIHTMYLLWNQIAFENDAFEIVETVGLSLYNQGEKRKSALLIGSALTVLSDAEMARNQFEKALEYAEKALEYVQNTDSLYEQARALNRRGVYIYMLGRLREAQRSFWSALELTKNTNEFPFIHERSFSYYQLAITETLLGYPLRGIEYAQKSLVTAQSAHILYEQICAYSVLGLANYLLANFSLGRESALQGIELAKRVDGWRMYGYLCSYAGLCETELGLLADAWEHGQMAIDIGRRQGHGEITGLGFRVLGEIYLHIGAVEKAKEAYQQGMSAAGQHFVAIENMIHFGYTQVLLGKPTGQQELVQAVNTAARAELGSIAVLGVIMELSMYLLVGERDLFETQAAWLRDQVIERTGQNVARFYIDRILAEDHFIKKDYQKAYELAQSSMDWYRQTQDSWNELNMAWIIEKSVQTLEIPYLSLRPRINELLDTFEIGLRDAPLQAEWQEFRAKFSA